MEHPGGIYLRATQDDVADIMFAWPYKFYTPQNIGRDYNSSHKRDAVAISFNDDNSIFHMTCKDEDVEFHITAFYKFMTAYIKIELNKATNDILSGDASQVEKLSVRDTDSLHRLYYLASRDADEQEPGQGILIGTGVHLLDIPYTNHVAKETRSRHVNTKLFDKTAELYRCELKWLGHSLQISSVDDPVMVKMTKDQLSPAITLLEGVHVDLYWVDRLLSSHRFRFYKVAKAADYTVYGVSNFIARYYDVHLTRWDFKSLQPLTVRSGVLYDIKWPKGTRNPWSRQKVFVYRANNYLSDQRMEADGSFSSYPRFVDPERAVAIHSWATGINAESGSREDEHETSSGASPGAAVDKIAQQLETTDIQEKLDPFDQDMRGPRKRSVPRLKASGSSAKPLASISSSTNKEPRPSFIDVLVKNVANLLSAIHLYQQEESTLVLKIGQLFVSSATANIPVDYRPSDCEETEAFRPHQWNTFFPSFPESETSEIISRTLFAPRLTCEDDDALFMSVTPLLSNPDKMVFNPRAEVDRTYYRIRGQNSKTGAIAVIEINQDGTFTMKGQPRETGFVNVHFPAYMWDARFVSTITLPLSDMDMEAFGKLLSTVWIGHEQSGLASRVEPLHALKPHHITILSVQRRRERTHQSTETMCGSDKLIPDEKQVYLHLTQVEELIIAKNIEEKDEFCAYSPIAPIPAAPAPGTNDKATASSEAHSSTTIKEKISSQRYWYEAHLHSSAINNLLPASTMAENPLTQHATKPSEHSHAKAGNTKGSKDDGDSISSTFTPPEWNPILTKILREALASTFNASHELITQWTHIGCRDRGAAPHIKPGGPRGGKRAHEGSVKSEDNALSEFVALAAGYGPHEYGYDGDSY